MLRLLYFLGVLAVTGAQQNNSDLVQEYINMWDAAVNQSLIWTRPTSNDAFDCAHFTDDGGNSTDEYDFVIIGGGTSGAVLADLLSENPERMVLLLEAGGDEDDFSRIPAATVALHSSPRNWGYLTVPQIIACQAMNNTQCPINKAKCLGGESSLNEVGYIRGNARDCDNWPGDWKTDSLKYFQKLEKVYGFPADIPVRGVAGHVSVTVPDYKAYFTDAIIAAHKELGYPALDYNGYQQLGASRAQVNTDNGQRQSTNAAYLGHAKCRKNLVIKTHSFATKINFNEDNDTVVSVNYVQGGKKFTATARKEFILSAGTVNSPQLLMLSGVGPKNHLESLNITVLHDLPVGQNLCEHITYFNLLMSTNYTPPLVKRETDFGNYLAGGGRLAQPVTGVQVSFRRIDGSLEGKPDIAFLHSTTPDYIKPVLIQQMTNMRSDIAAAAPKQGLNFITTNVMLTNPASRGTITLKTACPFDYPNIDPRFLSNSSDVDRLVWGIQELTRLNATNSLKAFNIQMANNALPLCPNTIPDRTNFWKCRISQTAQGNNDGVGTCSMGTNRRNSVVNSKLLVHGIKNLRVVDASVIPSCTSGNTVPMVIMIAETIADEIKCKYSSDFFYV